MNNTNIITKTVTSDYYGTVVYRLVFIHDFMEIMRLMVDAGIVDDESKDYIGFNVPKNMKQALACRDKISFSGHYVSSLRQLCGSYSIEMLSEERWCYAFFTVFQEDNKDWDYKGTGYYAATKKKKLPIGIREKDIENFYKKNGNYFPQYDFKTLEEMVEYFNNLYPSNTK